MKAKKILAMVIAVAILFGVISVEYKPITTTTSATSSMDELAKRISTFEVLLGERTPVPAEGLSVSSNYYRVDVETPGHLTIDYTPTSNGNSKLINIYSVTGEPITSKSAMWYNVKFTVELSVGIYYIEIRSPRDFYDLTVSFVSAPTTDVPPSTDTPPTTTPTEPGQDFIPGRIINKNTPTSIFDALEILKKLVGMPNLIDNP